MYQVDEIKRDFWEGNAKKRYRMIAKDRNGFKSILATAKFYQNDAVDTILRRQIVVQPDGTECMVVREISTGRNGKVLKDQIVSKKQISEIVKEKIFEEKIILSKFETTNFVHENERQINMMAKRSISSYTITKRKRKHSSIALELV